VRGELGANAGSPEMVDRRAESAPGVGVFGEVAPATARGRLGFQAEVLRDSRALLALPTDQTRKGPRQPSDP
jgi:hypothetical protein